MGQAFRILGYRVRGALGFNSPGKKFIIEGQVTRDKLFRMAEPLAKRFDAFEDNPWCLLYPEFDQIYPNVKFVLLIRNELDWIKSMKNFFGENKSPMNKFIYGEEFDPFTNEGHYLQIYRKHNQDVLEYFQNRPEDLLVLETEKLDWTPICDFLGVERPLDQFPHLNQGGVKKSQKNDSNIGKSLERIGKPLVSRIFARRIS